MTDHGSDVRGREMRVSPPSLRTEDGVSVQEGDRVFNYYDRVAGVIVPGSIRMLPDPWFDVRDDNGGVHLLNGQRICSVGFAERKGWL